jgi:pheromone shutdown protein TraB
MIFFLLNLFKSLTVLLVISKVRRVNVFEENNIANLGLQKRLIYNVWEVNCRCGAVLIYVYGTSHVSEDSFDVIDDAIEEHDPEVVALELDYPRLNSLLSDEKQTGGPIMIRLMRLFQESIGSRTGVMPGEEMEYAFERAMESQREVALVDQDIRVTVGRLKQVRRKEKVKAAISVVAGLLTGGSFDVSNIPEEEVIDELVEKMKEEFPGLYRVFMEERNQYIVEALKKVDEENEGDVVAFLGAAHVKKVKEMLDEVDSQSAVAAVEKRLESQPVSCFGRRFREKRTGTG